MSLRPFRVGSWLIGLILVAVLAWTGAWLGAYLRFGARWVPRAAPSEPATPSRRVDTVILITLDALRFDHVSAYGYPYRTTPRLDELAARGVVFTQAFAASTWTYPSLTSMLTSTSPSTHAVRFAGARLRDDLPFPARSLSEAGVATAFYVAHAQFGSSMTPGFAAGEASFRLPADRLTDRAIAYLRGRPAGPVFLWLHYIEPHDPYQNPDGLGALEPAGLAPPPASLSCPRPARIDPHNSATPPEFIQDGELDFAPYVARYDRYIHFADREIGRFLDYLLARPGAERTAVLVSSDHGEMFGEHGMVQHSGFPYDELIHVPLLVYLGGAAHPRRIESPVSNLDFLPTACELLGVRPPAACEGRSLVPLLEGSERAGRLIYAEAQRAGERTACLRGAGRKLFYAQFARPRVAYYDLRRDPCELAPLALDKVSWPRAPKMAYLYRSLIRHTSVFRPVEAQELDPATLRQLRELGYVR